jgi:hypothetical protein
MNYEWHGCCEQFKKWRFPEIDGDQFGASVPRIRGRDQAIGIFASGLVGDFAEVEQGLVDAAGEHGAGNDGGRIVGREREEGLNNARNEAVLIGDKVDQRDRWRGGWCAGIDGAASTEKSAVSALSQAASG